MADQQNQELDPVSESWDRNIKLRNDLASRAGKPDNLEIKPLDAPKQLVGSGASAVGTGIKELSLGDVARAGETVQKGSMLSEGVNWLAGKAADTFLSPENAAQAKMAAAAATGLADGENINRSDEETNKAVNTIADTADIVVKPVAQAIGSPIKDAGDWVKGTVSDQGKEAMNRQFFTEDKSGSLHAGDAWTADPAVWAMKMSDVIGTVGGTLVVGGAVKGGVKAAVTRSMLKRGAPEAYAAQVAELTAQRIGEKAAFSTGAAMSVGQTADQTRESVKSLSFEELMNSDSFKQNVQLVNQDPQYQSLSSSDRLDLARQRTADMAADYAKSDPTTYAAAAAGTVLGDAMLFKMITGKAGASAVTGNLLSRAGKGFVKGGVGEGVGEAVEEGAQQNIQNRSDNAIAGTNIDPMQGVKQSAAEAGFLGVMSGGGIGAGSSVAHGSNSSTQTSDSNDQDGDISPDQQGGLEQNSPDPESNSQPSDDLLNTPAYQRQGNISPELQAATQQVNAEQQQFKQALAAEENGVLAPIEKTVTGNPDEPAFLRTQQNNPTGRDPSELQDANPYTDVQQALSQGATKTPEQLISEAKLSQGKTASESELTGNMLLADSQPSAPIPINNDGVTIDGQANEVIPESRGIGYTGTINMPGTGGDGVNSNYIPPVTANRISADQSLGIESTRDPRSPVAQSIDSAGNQANDIFSQLQTLRVTKRGKPFASQKEALLASRKTETPIELPTGGFGVVDKAELEQVQSNISKQEATQYSRETAPAPDVNSIVNDISVGLPDGTKTTVGEQNTNQSSSSQAITPVIDVNDANASYINQPADSAIKNVLGVKTEKQSNNDGSSTYRFSFNDGHASVLTHSDGTAHIMDVQIGDGETAGLRGKGVGTKLYEHIGNELAKDGVTLESTRWSKHKSAISPAALRVWEKLEKAGAARVVGHENARVLDRFSGVNEVRDIPIYEFTSAGKEASQATVKQIDSSESTSTPVVAQNQPDINVNESSNGQAIENRSAADHGGDLRGSDINGEWVPFPDRSGSLKIPRSEMPQIKTADRGAMVNFLNARGVSHQDETIPAADLKPTQSEFSPSKVEGAKQNDSDRAVLVSSDGYVIDGHHQWMAKHDNGGSVRAIRLNATAKELIPLLHEFPSSTTDVSSGQSVAIEVKPKQVKGHGLIGTSVPVVTKESIDANVKELKAKQDAEFAGRIVDAGTGHADLDHVIAVFSKEPSFQEKRNSEKQQQSIYNTIKGARGIDDAYKFQKWLDSNWQSDRDNALQIAKDVYAEKYRANNGGEPTEQISEPIYSSEDRPDGTMIIKGDTKELKVWAKENGITAASHKDGIIVGRKSVDSAKSIINQLNKGNEVSKETEVNNVGDDRGLPISEIIKDGMDTSDLVSWISKNSKNESYRMIAKRIATSIPSGIDVMVVKAGDKLRKEVPSSMNISNGMYWTKGDEKTLILKDASFGEEHGLNEETALHELIHAATMRAIREGNKVKADKENPELSQAVSDLYALQKAVVKHLDETKDDIGLSKLMAASQVKELVAWGMTNKEFQGILQKIPYENKTAWNKFVSLVAQLLGLKQSDNTALGELIRVTDNILSATNGNSDSKTKQSVDSDSQTKTKISDFGEKIGGAKKDVWQSMKDTMRGDTQEEIKTLPLSKAWPEPDYQKLIDNGMDGWTVGFIRAARESIPTKPKLSNRVSTWADQVKVLRDLSVDLADGNIRAEHLKEKVNALGGRMRYINRIMDKADLYHSVGHGKSLESLDLTSGQYSIFNGEKFSPSKVIWSVERKAKSTAFGNWPRMIVHADTKEQVIQQFKALYESLPTESEAKKQTATFDVFSKRDGSGFYVGKKIGRNPALLAGPFYDVKSARQYKEEHTQELIDKLEKFKEIPNERRDTNNPRIGEDMRGGKDVTPEMFADAFGFRGVEFGNWVEQSKRQSDLNRAYDALMDLAAIVDIPPKAISLNGELGIAFGARGNGGVHPAAAHYEPGKVVINLTKKNGAGSLGHEWWHAVDDYFARMRGNGAENMTESRMVRLSSKGSDYFHSGGVRKEMVDAFGKIIKGINDTAMEARSSKLDAKRSKDYWTTKTEMSARAFESYLISKLQDQNASNDYLSNVTSPETWESAEKLGFELDSSYPYPTAGEIPAIRGAFDHFFSVIDYKTEENGNVALFSKSSFEQNEAEKSGKGMTKPEAELAAKEWLKQFKTDVQVKVAKDQAEFDQLMTEAGQGGTLNADEIANAAYLPESKTLLLNASAIQNPARLRQLMRHEILGHHGLEYVIGKGAVNDILQILKNGYATSKAIRDAVDTVAANYADADVKTKIKEAFAHYAENRPVDQGPLGRLWDRVVSAVKSALVKAGFIRANEAEKQLDSILKTIAENMRQGRSDNGPNGGTGNKAYFSKGKNGDTSAYGQAGSLLKESGSSLVNWLKQQRGRGLGTLTDLQIDQIYRDITGGAVNRYQKLRTKMESDRNDILLEAETKYDPMWEAMPEKEKAALSRLMHDATMSRLHPDKSLEENSLYQEVKDKLAKARTEKTKAEYQAELDIIRDNYRNLSERYRLSSKQSKELYATMRDLYSAQWEKLRDAISQRIEDQMGEGGKALASQMRLRMEQALRHGPYFPLARFGDYVVKARKDGEYIREHFEKRKDAEAALNQYRRDGYKAVMTVKETSAGDQANAHALGMEVIEALDKAQAEGTAPAELKDTVWQAMLDMLPDSSYAKHAIHRKRIKGASRDGHRAYLQSVYHFAHHVSKIRYGHQMKAELDGMKEQVQLAVQGEESNIKPDEAEIAQQVLNEMNLRHEMNMNPKGSALAGQLGNLGFMFYLGASPASAMVNLTQNVTVMLPQLAGKYGFVKAAKFMLQAMVDYMRHGVFQKGTKEAWVSLTRATNAAITADEKAMLNKLYKAGVLDLTQAHSIAARADTDQQNIKPGKQWARTGMRWAGALFHNAEVLNREVAALTAYRLMKAQQPGIASDVLKGDSAAIDQVAEMVYDGHGNYAASNRPRYMRSDVMKVLTQFKIYSQMMTYTLARNAVLAAKGDKTALKTLGVMFGTTWMMAGMMGMPTPVGLILYGLASLFDDDDDRTGEASFRLGLTEVFGAEVGELIAKGPVDAISGLNISGRTGLSDLWWRSPKEGTEGDDLTFHYVQQIAGPVLGIGVSAVRGMREFANGDIQRGVEAMSPKAVKDLAKAYRQATEGEQTRNGDSVIDDVGAWNVAMQAMGFSSAQMAKVYSAREYIKGKEKIIEDRRSNLLADYFTAMREQDTDAMQDVMDNIREFNASHNKAEAITGKTLKQSIKSRERSGERTQAGTYLSSKREYLRSEGAFLSSLD